jgi:hypothetical protein
MFIDRDIPNAVLGVERVGNDTHHLSPFSNCLERLYTDVVVPEENNPHWRFRPP